jgi:predicted Rossmann fold flavoprotein
MMSDTNFDVIILGAGGAGLMCGAKAGARGRRVLILDHAEQVGKKILISGGGRCNFTNANADQADRFICSNPHFAKSALSRFRPADFIQMVDDFGIAWHEKTLGQLFCDGSARQIVDMLLMHCTPNCAIKTCVSITDVAHRGGVFHVTAGGHAYTASSLVIATGGPSIPKMGATGFAYDLARQFGLKVVEPRPALVPFTLGGEDVLFRELSGVSADVIAKTGKAAFAEAALLTHKGLSGPAILQVSSYWRHGDAVEIDFLPQMDAGWLRALKRSHPRSTVKSVLSGMLSSRLADTLAERIAASQAGIGGNLADTPDRVLEGIEHNLAAWTFHPNGTEGYAKAEVTAGGISTAELSQQTMEAKKVPGLFAIGEAVDVTGWLGGYNFQWAWASGVAAGEAV